MVHRRYRQQCPSPVTSLTVNQIVSLSRDGGFQFQDIAANNSIARQTRGTGVVDRKAKHGYPTVVPVLSLGAIPGTHPPQYETKQNGSSPAPLSRIPWGPDYGESKNKNGNGKNSGK